jgi:hypothetical protein
MGNSSPSSGLRETAGFVDGLIRQSRLVWRLWRDGRVPGWIKLIPYAGQTGWVERTGRSGLRTLH